MGSGVFSNAPTAPPSHNADIAVDGDGVLFSNFGIGSFKPLRSHKDYIRKTYVPFVMKQVDIFGYKRTGWILSLRAVCTRGVQGDRARAGK